MNTWRHSKPSLFTLFLCFLLSTRGGQYTPRLNPFINYYEPVVYEAIPLAQIFREDNKEGYGEHTVRFRAFGRAFDLLLHRGSQVLSPSAQIMVQSDNKTEFLPVGSIHRHVVHGSVYGEPGSIVQGHVFTGGFDGIIILENENYFVEPSNTFFDYPVDFKSIIYRSSDLNRTVMNCPPGKNQTCQPFRLDELRHDKSNTYINHFVDTERRKENEKICTLKLVADHTFFEYAADRTLEKIIFEMLVLVAFAHQIFINSDFDFDNLGDGFGFQIMNIQIWKSANEPNYQLYNERLTANEFLEKFSENDFSDYCLALSFTFREFPNSVLGLAHTAVPYVNLPGGICSRNTPGGSFNTAVVSIRGARGRNPRAVNIVTLTHEIGHNFGSVHDDLKDPECSPHDDDGGQFIMAAYAVSGTLPNNNKFSPCSRELIGKVIPVKGGCFTTSMALGSSICGNAITNTGEECDCGEPSQCEDIDPCCTPKGGDSKDKECTFRIFSLGAVCSHRESRCCTSRCTFVDKDQQVNCYEHEECVEPAYCDGTTYKCPMKKNKRDGTPCRNNAGHCKQGVCRNSICYLYKLKECECGSAKYSCHICCEKDTLCVPISHLGVLDKYGNELMKIDGEPCNEARGVCKDKLCKTPGEYAFTTAPDEQKFKDETRSKQFVLGLIIFGVILVLLLVIFVCLYLLTPLKNIFGRRSSTAR